MLVTALLIPITMIVFGHTFMKHAPKNINYAYGYRTKRSMMNRETWEFAHGYIGKLWFIGGWILLPVSAAVMLFVLGKETDTVGTVGGILVFLQLIPLFGTVIPTEKALMKNFDEFGRQR